jgi:hypothetical protein
LPVRHSNFQKLKIKKIGEGPFEGWGNRNEDHA